MQTISWDNTKLVVFDLDGTLYDQNRLRAIMGSKLIFDALKSWSFNTIEVLRAFRKCREDLAADMQYGFVDGQFELAAARCGCTVSEVKSLVNEWIEQRPLRHLAGCRYPGVAELFSALRQSGRIIAILSDYAVEGKLAALELKADVMVSAEDIDVQRLKPDPKGLSRILDITGMSAKCSLMIGDRFDRDWEVANRLGMNAIIRSRHTDARCITFRSYHDKLFDAVKQLPGKGISVNTRFTRQDDNVPEF